MKSSIIGQRFFIESIGKKWMRGKVNGDGISWSTQPADHGIILWKFNGGLGKCRLRRTFAWLLFISIVIKSSEGNSGSLVASILNSAARSARGYILVLHNPRCTCRCIRTHHFPTCTQNASVLIEPCHSSLARRYECRSLSRPTFLFFNRCRDLLFSINNTLIVIHVRWFISKEWKINPFRMKVSNTYKFKFQMHSLKKNNGVPFSRG